MYIRQDRLISASFLILISGNITVSLALRTCKEELQDRVSLNQPLVKGKSWTNTLISFTFATLAPFVFTINFIAAPIKSPMYYLYIPARFTLC